MTLQLALAAVMTAASLWGQVTPATAPQVAAEAVQPSPAAAAPVKMLSKGTMVRMMVLKEVNSRDHPTGHRFAVRVDEDVKVGGVTVIPVGAKGWGEVVGSEGTGSAGKSGRVNARLLYVEAEGQKIPLDGQRESSGSGGTGQAVVSVLAFGPLGLLMKGNNATLKAGEIINGYTSSDAVFDVAQPAVTP